MTNTEAKKILESYIACESKKAHFECSEYNCDNSCPLLYEMGTVGEFNEAINMGIKALEQTQWIPCSERLPETDNENNINSFNVLLWVKNKTHPEKEAQIYLGKLRHIDGDDGSGNFWGIETKPCEWTIWGWSYFNEPEVIAWMPLPKPYKGEKA